MRKLFGTDGVRGVANTYPMTTEIAMQIGRALAFLVKDMRRGHRIVIGKDTRLSCYMIENALAAGICSMGVDILLVGPLPTPGIAFITTSMRADAGVVISASHNPFQDNGIKISGPKAIVGREKFLTAKAINISGLKEPTAVQVPLVLRPALLELMGETVVTANVVIREKKGWP